MRAALCLLAIALLLPLAAADQNVSVGPATVKTVNTQTGSCESGNGYESHTASAVVEVTEHESLYADASSSCSAYSSHDPMGGYWNQTSNNLGVYAGRRTDDAVGPFVAVAWFDQWQGGSWGETHWCGSQVYVSGPVVHLGCWPNGERPPMLPALP